jgi:hypothetical protein
MPVSGSSRRTEDLDGEHGGQRGQRQIASQARYNGAGRPTQTATVRTLGPPSRTGRSRQRRTPSPDSVVTVKC